MTAPNALLGSIDDGGCGTPSVQLPLQGPPAPTSLSVKGVLFDNVIRILLSGMAEVSSTRDDNVRLNAHPRREPVAHCRRALPLGWRFTVKLLPEHDIDFRKQRAIDIQIPGEVSCLELADALREVFNVGPVNIRRYFELVNEGG